MTTFIVEQEEGEDFQGVAYLTQRDNSAIQQGDVSSINTKVFDLNADDPATAVYSSTEVVANVVFNAEQTDGYATRAGKTRYNFRPTPISNANHGMRSGRQYLVEYQLVGADVGGGDLFVRYMIERVNGGFTTA